MASPAAALSTAKKIDDEKRVFAALRTIFAGAEARLRNDNRHDSDLESLTRDYRIPDICVSAKSLLEKGFFESDADIDVLFPSSSSDGRPVEGVSRAVATPSAMASTPMILRPKGVNARRGKVDLPFPIQHRLLIVLQEILENVCYAFAQQHMPHVLENEGWCCAEAVELSQWAKVLARKGSIYHELVELQGADTSLLASLSRLRVTAVHRVRLTANSTLRFIVDGEAFAHVLGDKERAQSISELRRHAESLVRELCYGETSVALA